jgi:hypothetical protein
MRSVLDLVRAFPTTTFVIVMLLIFLPTIIEIFTAILRLQARM